MPFASRLQLPFAAWPSADQRAWIKAATAAHRFDESGLGAHLADSTKRALKTVYSEYLKFIAERRPRLMKRCLADRVSRNLVAEFVEWLGPSRSKRSAAISLHHLRLALRLLKPEVDWTWLLIVTKRLSYLAPRQPPKLNLVTSERLYQVGFALMDEAISETSFGEEVCESDAVLYRDGLIIAFLAELPLRRRSLAALRIGGNIVRAGDIWSVDVAAEDTKTRHSIECPLSRALSERIDVYIAKFRPTIRGAKQHSALWASAKGGAVSYSALYDVICKRTDKVLGFRVNPHRFRHAAGSFWSIHDPRNVAGVRDLLGQTSFATTEQFYIPTASRLAGRVLANIIDAKQ